MLTTTLLAGTVPASEYPPSPSSLCTPCTRLDTEEVQQGVAAIATAFFGTALKGTGDDGIHFTRYLAPSPPPAGATARHARGKDRRRQASV